MTVDNLARYQRPDPGARPTSIGATEDYVRSHLCSPKEAGVFRYASGYLTRQGAVKVVFLDPELWLQVGLTQEELDQGILPEDLLSSLLQGKDRTGTKLLPRLKGGFGQPNELLIPLPTEISHLMQEREPEAGLGLIHEVTSCAFRQLSACAVRLSRGGRKLPYRDRVKPSEGRPLAFYVPHGENRAGEPEMHSHTFVLKPVLCPDGTWRSLDVGEHIRRLQRGGGRAKITKALAGLLDRHGFRCVWTAGRQMEHPTQPPGVTVIRPDGSAIEAGSIITQRSVGIYGLRILVREMGGDMTRAEEDDLRRVLKAARCSRDRMRAIPTEHQTRHGHVPWGVHSWGPRARVHGLEAWEMSLIEAAEWAKVEHPGKLGQAVAEWILAPGRLDSVPLVSAECGRIEAIARTYQRLFEAMEWILRDITPIGLRPCEPYLLRTLQRNGWARWNQRRKVHELTSQGLELFHRLGSALDVPRLQFDGLPIGGLPAAADLASEPVLDSAGGPVFQGHPGRGGGCPRPAPGREDRGNGGARPQHSPQRRKNGQRRKGRDGHGLRQPCDGPSPQADLVGLPGSGCGISTSGTGTEQPDHCDGVDSLQPSSSRSARRTLPGKARTHQTTGDSSRSEGREGNRGGLRDTRSARAGRTLGPQKEKDAGTHLGSNDRKAHLGSDSPLAGASRRHRRTPPTGGNASAAAHRSDLGRPRAAASTEPEALGPAEALESLVGFDRPTTPAPAARTPDAGKNSGRVGRGTCRLPHASGPGAVQESRCMLHEHPAPVLDLGRRLGPHRSRLTALLVAGGAMNRNPEAGLGSGLLNFKQVREPQNQERPYPNATSACSRPFRAIR